MSRDKKDDRFQTSAEAIRRAGEYVRPLAKRSGTTAKHGVHAARARLAPRIERTGQAVQDTVAPRVAAYLSTTARRVAPDVPRRSRWQLPVRIAGLAAAAGAVTAVVRKRTKPQRTGSPVDAVQVDTAATDETE